jgi:hypothetical protein
LSLSQQLQEAATERAPYAISKEVPHSERAARILHKVHLFGAGVVSPEHAKKTWDIERPELDHLVKTGHLKLIKSGKQKGWYELTDKGADFIRRSRQKKESLDDLFDEVLAEAQGDTGALSKVKKKPAPHMWFIAKTGKNAWVVSIGDPTKTSSKIKRTFHSKDDLKYWVKYEMADQVSPNHVIDRSGLKLMPDYYTQWYVDNMKGK